LLVERSAFRLADVRRFGLVEAFAQQVGNALPVLLCDRVQDLGASQAFGGPKDKLFTDAPRVALKRPDGQDKKTALAKIAEKLVKEALNGSIQAIGMIMDRIEGKPVQALDIKHDDRNDIDQFSDAELTAIMRGRMTAAVDKPKPRQVNDDGNVLN
jgi:hypothetical protein